MNQDLDCSSERHAPAKHWWLIAAGLLILYASLVAGLVRTQAPYLDEGFFAPPAWSLIQNGNFGSETLEECVYPLRRPQWMTLPGIHQRTYWQMPGYFLLQAGVYHLFGFGLVPMRALSALGGAVWMVMAGYVVWRLTGRKWVALATAMLLSLDMAVLHWAAIGRPDLPCAAFWMSGCAAYLALRENRPWLALFLSHLLVAGAGMMHPVGGVVGLLTLAWLQFCISPRRWSGRELAAIAAPYALVGSIWLSYVLQAPGDWAAQFFSNSAGRLDAWRHPWTILYEELSIRLLPAYGLRSDSVWFSPVKLITPLLYAVAFFWFLFRRQWRQESVIGVLLGWAVVQAGVLVVFDGLRSESYLVHALFAPAAMAAILLLRPGRWRPACVAVLVLLGVLYALNAVRIIRKDPWEERYNPMVAMMQKVAPPQATITGSSELSFALGFDGRLRDDFSLGYCSGRRSDFLVVSSDYESAWRSSDYPGAVHVAQERSHYRLLGEAGAYKIYQRQP